MMKALQPHWLTWLRTYNTLTDTQIAAIPRIHFDQSLMAIDAARQGLVMTSPHLVEAAGQPPRSRRASSDCMSRRPSTIT